ncbi:thermonuclease family protein [bacterium]|nr:thermonuclease family protein [bacterium]
MTLVLVLFFNYGLSLANNCAHDAKAFRCVKYLKNHDGDTVTFEIPNVHPLLGHKISVRVNGLDTPEIRGKQPCEKQAARAAKKLIENLLKNAKVIHIENPSRDKYFRILGDVTVDGKSLAQILLKNKLAYEYSGQAKHKIDWCTFGQQRKTAGDRQ